MAGFQFDPGSGAIAPAQPVQATAGLVQLGNGGVVGGGQAAPVQAAQPAQPTQQDRTFDTLLQLGKGILEQKMEQQQQQAMLQGVQKVMAGSALKDIVDEQPWYTKIFGPTSTVQGARAYAQVAQVDKYTADLYGNMAHYQTVDPSEVGKEVSAKMSEYMTGDAETDTAIQMRMVESLGPFFKAQAKANYKYVQDTMAKAQWHAMDSSANALQAAATSAAENGTATAEDMNHTVGSAIAAMMPMRGQNFDSWQDNITNSLITSMAKGNHYLVKAAFQKVDGQSSIVDALDAEHQQKLLDARDSYEKKTMEKEGTLEFGTKMGILAGQAKAGIISLPDALKQMAALNHQFQIKTGIDSPLYSTSDVEKLVSTDYAKMYSNAKEARKESASEIAKQRELGEANRLVGAYGAQAALNNGSDKTMIDGLAFNQLNMRAGSDVKQRALYMLGQWNGTPAGSGYIIPQIKQQLERQVDSGSVAYTPQIDAAADQFKAMRDAGPTGRAMAYAYLGADKAARLEEYLQYRDIPGGTPESAWQLAFGKPINTLQTTPPAKMAKKVIEAAKANTTSKFAEFFLPSKFALNGPSQQLLASTMASVYDKMNAKLVPDSSQDNLDFIFDVASQQLDLVGSYAIQKYDPSDKPLNVLIGSDPETAGRVLNDWIATEGKARGYEFPTSVYSRDAGETGSMTRPATGNRMLDARGLNIGQLEQWTQQGPQLVVRAARPDAEGQPRQYIITGYAHDKTVNMTVDSETLRKFYESRSYFK